LSAVVEVVQEAVELLDGVVVEREALLDPSGSGKTVGETKTVHRLEVRSG
jgi:hypothetical protein